MQQSKRVMTAAGEFTPLAAAGKTIKSMVHGFDLGSERGNKVFTIFNELEKFLKW
jgi:hypothetical protein